MLRMKLLGFAVLVLVVGGQPALARKINLDDNSRRCLSTSIVPNPRLQNASACVAHNSCSRTVFADAYPFHARRAEAPTHAKVSRWLKTGKQ